MYKAQTNTLSISSRKFILRLKKPFYIECDVKLKTLWKNKHICIDLKLCKLESNNSVSVSVMCCTSSLLSISQKNNKARRQRLRAGIPDKGLEEILHIRSQCTYFNI